MNRQALFFILFFCLLLALAIITVDAHNSCHRNYGTVTETAARTATVTVTHAHCEPSHTEHVSCQPTAMPKKRHDGHNRHRKATVTCVPTTTMCVM